MTSSTEHRKKAYKSNNPFSANITWTSEAVPPRPGTQDFVRFVSSAVPAKHSDFTKQAHIPKLVHQVSLPDFDHTLRDESVKGVIGDAA